MSHDQQQTLMTALSWRSVYRWKSDYLQSGGDFRALIPVINKRGGVGQSRLAPEVEALVTSVIRDNYYKPEQVTIRDLVCLIAAAIEEENKLRPSGEHLSVPGEATIAQGKTRLEQETINRTLKGNQKNIVLSWSVVPGYEETFSKVLVSLVDITELTMPVCPQ